MSVRWLIFILVAGSLGCDSRDGRPQTLDPGDVAAIRRLDSTFVSGWLADDTAKVLSLFAPDAILLPPSSPPVAGTAAIRAYWWPTDGSHTRILTFDRRIDEITGGPTLAYLRGSGGLTWSYTKDGQTSHQASRSNDLLLVTRDPGGRWRIVRQIWNPLP